MIENKLISFYQDSFALRDWVMRITQSFWNEFMVCPNFEVSLSNINSKSKTKNESVIIPLLRKYLESLIANSTKLRDIPEQVQVILYNNIKNGEYFSKAFLPSYIIQRIEYNFYGGTKNLNKEQIGMLLAFLIISKISVSEIMLNINDCFENFKKNSNIEKNAKFIGSIMRYLVRDTFYNNPTVLKDIISMFNYYRNCHIYNRYIESVDAIFDENIEIRDEYEDELCLVPFGIIKEFCNSNPEFVKTFKNYVYLWAGRLGKELILKFGKEDNVLFYRKRLEIPKTKRNSK